MALITAERTAGDYGFTITDSASHQFQIDIPVTQGGDGNGLRPMQTVLGALCGCSAVDVVSILKKQRQELKDFKISVDGEREEGKEPSLWKRVEMKFELSGDIDLSKAYRAVELSIDKYCSVAETLRRAGASIEWSVTVNGEKAG